MNRHRTYRPPLPQISADPLRGNPCDSRDLRRCVQPLKGLRETRAAAVSYRALVPAGHAGCGDALSYRALAPGGAGTWCRTCAGTSGVPQPTVHSSLLTVHSSSASGWQTFKYGKLGEVTENIRTFALPFENRTYTFKMQYEYDSWNRIQSMTYPDGEVVTYDYNLGGMLEKVYGGVTIDNIAAVDPDPLRNGGMTPTDDPVFTYTYPYIDSIAYNEFELKSEVFHGNGTHTLYFYDNIQRLQLLQSRTRAGEIMQDIIYSYDAVNNITDIANTAGELSNYLGGTNSRHYEYDSLYRLVYSYGQWDNIGKDVHLKDTLRMSCYKNGRISSKSSYANLYTEDNLGPNSPTRISKRSYQYNTQQPNTLASVYDSLANTHQYFLWDRTGNMTEQNPATSQSGLCTYTWTEDNRLQTVQDNQWFSYYQYDANGDRTCKLPCSNTSGNRSGERSVYWTPENPTLYASPYLVITPRGYTKHYYAETERITSQIGRGKFPVLTSPVTDTATANRKVRRADSLVLAFNSSITDTSAQLAYLAALTERQNDTCEAYWYHTDHLGSSSWITDSAGNPVQHLHYLPWGEDFVNQRTTDFSARYTFSAKERDPETGLSYFGSRYYSSDLSIWLSVDPMSDKYASLSPYVYCADNPVKLVDPNGEEIDPESMQAWNTLKSDIIDRKNFLKPYAILNKITHGVLCNKEADRYNSLCNTLNSMEDLKYSDQLYRLGTIDGSVGNVTLNDDESLTINYCNTANFIHEMTHCVQFERGDIGFFKGKGAQAFTDVYDEIESYTAQAAYDPTTIPNYSKRYMPLTPQWVKHMKYSDGGYIYSNCGLIRYDGNATASDMNRVFPDAFEPYEFEGKLREQPGVYFK